MNATTSTVVSDGVTSELFSRALALPEKERAALAMQLIRSLDPEGVEKEPGYDEAWKAEIEKRSRSLAEGRSVPVSREEAESRIRQAISEARASRSIPAGPSA